MIGLLACLQLGRPVPVLIPRECNAVLAYLADDQVRKEAAINKTSPYIFANSCFGVVRGYDALKSACDECSADLIYPQRITTTSLRKYCATITQVRN